MELARFISKFVHQFFINKELMLTIANRLWGTASGLVTLVIITEYMTLEWQGYYYIFLSLFSFQVLIDCGFIYAISQFASYEKANLTWDDSGNLVGCENSKLRLRALIKLVIVWLGFGVAFMNFVILPVGLIFLKSKWGYMDGFTSKIGVPWSIAIFSNSILLIINAYLGVLESCGKIREVLLVRFFQSVSSTLILWLVITIGGDMLALASQSMTSLIIGASIIYKKFGGFVMNYTDISTPLLNIRLKTEFFPFQLKLAISWISGYLVQQTIVPIIFSELGPAEAGRYGLSIQIFNSLTTFSIAWVTIVAPQFGSLIAKKEHETLEKKFTHSARASKHVLYFLVLFFCCAFVLAYNYNISFINRILEAKYLLLLALSAIILNASNAMSLYLRAFKEDRLVYVTVIQGLITIIVCYFGLGWFGIAGAVFGYTAGNIVYYLGARYYLIQKKIEISNGVNFV